MKIQKRELTLDTRRADTKRRTVPVVLSTEHPVNRGDYLEVLLHGPENVDLSRSPLPLIESHDGSRLNVGLVDNLRLSGGKLRGDLVLGNSDRARELWPDIEAGIIRHLSIGYLIHDFENRADNVLAATRWQPFEASLVSIPADPNAGTYRSMNMEHENITETEHLSRSQRRALKAERTDTGAEAELKRVNEILEIADAYKRFGLDDVAQYAIRHKLSVDEFRAKSLEKMSNAPKPSADIGYPDDLSQASRNFSLTRMLSSIIDPRSTDAGYEREVSQELTRQLGRKPNGFWMPIGTGQRDLTVAGAPALVGTQHMSPEFIDLLRARSFVMRLGPRLLGGLTQDVSIPRLTTSATSGWIAGDGVDGLTPSNQGLDAVTLTPHTVGALTVLSRKMILQGAPDAENMVRQDFAQLIAAELDRAAIAGSGATNQPTGIINTASITESTFPNAGPDFASVVGMEGALMADNADLGSLAYMTTPALAAALKTTETASGSGQFVWTAGAERGAGQMNGLPAYATSNVPTDTIILGNWNDLLVGMWGAVDVDVDPHYNFERGSIAVRIFASVDFAVRHPESFAVYTRGAP